MSPWFDPDLELTHTLFHEGDRAGGMAACERLLSRPGLPEEVETLVRRNQTWHTDCLARARQGPFNEPPYWRDQELVVPPVVDRHGVVHHSACNPSIAESDDDLYCLVRSTNYTITPQGRYLMDGEIVSTVNHLLHLAPQSLEVVTSQVIDDERHREDDAWLVRGHEDARLFHDTGTWRYVATVRDRSGERGMAQMLECELNPAGWHGPTVERSVLLSDGRRHEKNWMPWPYHSLGLGYVYSLEPTIILAGDDVGQRPDSGLYADGLYLLRHARGGSQVVLWSEDPHAPDRYLCLAHESVTFEAPYRKVYTHRVVELNSYHDVTAVSAPFTFRGMGIEFAAGLVVRPEEGEAIISYGINDQRAYLLRLPLAELLGLLRPVTEADRWLA